MTMSGVIALSSMLNWNKSSSNVLIVSGQVILIEGLDLVIMSGDKETGEPGLTERGLEVTGVLRLRIFIGLIGLMGRTVFILRGEGTGELPRLVLATVRGEQGEPGRGDEAPERGEAVRGLSGCVI